MTVSRSAPPSGVLPEELRDPTNPAPPVHLCIMQPLGSYGWFGLLDPVRYFRYQLRRLGCEVTVAKNRLHHDAVNIVFNAHVGFDPALLDRYACVLANLEQLGPDGARVPADYRALLGSSAVVDYDPDNPSAYTARPEDVPVVPFLYAPYLKPEESIPLEERSIDLLFFGTVNARRRSWLDRIEACGRSVTIFERGIFGDQRDALIKQAKAVVNAHFYGACRFEQVRTSLCLSLGTPVISERTARTRPPVEFERCVTWLEGDRLEEFFLDEFGTPEYFDTARAALLRFERTDPIEAYADLLTSAVTAARLGRRAAGPWRPTRINLGSGRKYLPGWLNIDLTERSEPDLILDLSAPLALPFVTSTVTTGSMVLAENSVEVINADNVLEHVHDLVTLMGNCLRLLATGGELRIEVPYEHAVSAWQDPTHVRAMNENSWKYYAEWSWYLGWFDHRFEVARLVYLDDGLNECPQGRAVFMKVLLRKIATSTAERNWARVAQADLRLPSDDVPADQLYRPCRAATAAVVTEAAVL